MRQRFSFFMRPIYLAYWTAAAVLIGMLLAPEDLRQTTLATATHHHDATHAHTIVEVDPVVPPKVTIAAAKDATSGWNITVSTENFTFAPEMANQRNVPNHGHAHLYLNGRKIARLYGPAYHISDMPNGKNTIAVSLNANDHSDLVLNGQPIVSKVVLETNNGSLTTSFAGDQTNHTYQ